MEQNPNKDDFWYQTSLLVEKKVEPAELPMAFYNVNQDVTKNVVLAEQVDDARVHQMSLMTAAPGAPAAAGFDFSIASIGAGVGLVAGFAITKFLSSGKKHDNNFSAT